MGLIMTAAMMGSVAAIACNIKRLFTLCPPVGPVHLRMSLKAGGFSLDCKEKFLLGKWRRFANHKNGGRPYRFLSFNHPIAIDSIIQFSVPLLAVARLTLYCGAKPPARKQGSAGFCLNSAAFNVKETTRTAMR
jgi:hypothetical protein